ncbi:MAG: hypothetical protein KME14_20340 [Tildeniella torsiva UHER 1998/13D]|jgi:hypothetical protein|nr:hypothetical protein [Tildeniella torsiva UHER 1998/13D]
MKLHPGDVMLACASILAVTIFFATAILVRAETPARDQFPVLAPRP